MANYSETFYQLLVDDSGDNRPLTLTAENLAQLNEQVITKSKSKITSDEVHGTIVKLKTILDGFLQQHNVLNPKDRNTIECRLSATNFSRKAFLIDGIDGTNYPGIYSFAFFDKMRKVTTMSKLEKKGTCYQSQCFCQKSYLCDGEERTGDFKILLAFTNYSDTKVDLYMSMKGFPVLSNVKGSSSSKENSTESVDGKKKRKRKEEDQQESTKKTQASPSGLASSSFGEISSFERESYQALANDLEKTTSFATAAAASTTDEDMEAALPFATSEAYTTDDPSALSQESMIALLNQQTPLTSSNVESLIPPPITTDNTQIPVNFQHQLWDPSFYYSNLMFQGLYRQLEDQVKQNNLLKTEGKKLIEINSKLRKINHEFTRENETLKHEVEELRRNDNSKQIKSQKIPEHEEELVIDDEYQSKEKQPLLVENIFRLDSDDTYQESIFSGKPEQEDGDMDFFNVEEEFYDSFK
ncbi:predicted protein [Naegleria gruberi]|uniref:Predicted protein n=1 Tax=Naegleria gruberi TaxID=5762 RepID=D2V4W1_NAEGR|nr:uncharacterized protein NAEGRDRAFT_63926 [Naegleria gruberi]EFC48174.1 predicted protein [Naegleria gruberi]|eukprot:XP_002680918.1 predicted protein [Naegleria gruberi strain NEG-M]